MIFKKGKFSQAMDEAEKIFWANFQILGPYRCQGWVVIAQNVKKATITAPYCAVQQVKGVVLSPQRDYR